MFKINKVDEKFLKASKEHIIIHNHIQLFQDLLAKESTDEWRHLLQQALGPFESDIRAHFELEEQVLFPAALTCLSSLEICDMVLKFQKEHGYFEKDLMMLQSRLSTETDEDLRAFLEQFLKQFREHALAETQQLYYLMDREKACQRLIKGIIIPA